VVDPRQSDTIAAIATPPGVGGIGIVRISGPDALSILSRLFRPRHPSRFPRSHHLSYGTLVRADGRLLDEVLAVYMKGPATYTREDVVEIHSHGSWLVLRMILAEVLATGARPAEPGEFTKRAFLAGRIDLTRAEAVMELLAARSEAGAHLAVSQMQGALAGRVEKVREALVRQRAVMEVAIDFPDEDVEILDGTALLQALEQEVLEPLRDLIRMADQGRLLRDGVQVVIAGRPNVGKSSLLNGLLREERALVTSVPGTTRDTIEETVLIGSVPVHLVDTAGIRDDDRDQVERLGIERARSKMAQADLILFLVDAAAGVGRGDRELYRDVQNRKHLLVVNKVDLLAREDEVKGLDLLGGDREIIHISARTGEGLEELRQAMIRQICTDGQELADAIACAPNVRHKVSLQAALHACERLAAALTAGEPADLLAIEVQEALDHLGEIVGLTTPEDVLDRIFAEFCIGK